MMKKFVSLLLACLMVFNLLGITAFAAEDPVVITMDVDAASVKVGDIVSVTVSADKELANMNAWGYDIYVDNQVFVLDSAEYFYKDAVATDTIERHSCVNVSGFYLMQNYTGPAGKIATLKFRAVKAAKETKIELKHVEFCDGDTAEYLNYTVGGVKGSYQTGTLTAAVDVIEETSAVGYSVTASQDKTITVGETAEVQVAVSSENAATYNAYDLTMTYDTEKLRYVSAAAADTDASITEENGTIHVIGYGADKAVDTAAVTLRFAAKAVGDAAVKLTSAKVDMGSNAIAQDAPEATILNDTTVITVSAYTVTLDEGLRGESTALPGADYTFYATEENYDYQITATVGGAVVEVIDNGDGSYTIPGSKVTGNIVISAELTPKSYNVIINGEDTTGANKATYNKDYTFTIQEAEGYTYEVAVTIGGQAYAGYSVSNGVYTIPGAAIKGEIVITVTKTAIPATKVNVTVEGTGAGDVTGESTATKGQAYTFSVNQKEGYVYEVTVTVGGKKVDVTDNGDGTYTIPGEAVTADILITVSKTADLVVDVTEYLTLDGESMYLVTVSGTIAEGSVAKYDGMSMYWSEKYNAYAWLVISADSLDAIKTDAAQKIAIAQGSAAGNVDYTGDVNGTGLVDVNDAQLTYDMYNAAYTLDSVAMLKFLNADVNADKTVNVNDAAAIVARIR